MTSASAAEKEKKPKQGVLYVCQVQNYGTKKKVNVLLCWIGRGDVSWVTAEDGWEFDESNWSVLKWEPALKRNYDYSIFPAAAQLREAAERLA